MGNTPSGTGETFASAAMAKYMSLSKTQLKEIRESCKFLGRGAKIHRKFFLMALGKNRVSNYPDIEILDHLFTLYDDKNNDTITYDDFLIGISPLACPGANFDEIFLFALEMYDIGCKNQIGVKDLMHVLKQLIRVAQVFGDASWFTLTHIYKVCDGVFDTMTMVTETPNKKLSHKKCAECLSEEPLIHKLFETPREVLVRRKNKPSKKARVKIIEAPFNSTRLEDESLMTDISSVLLSPINKQNTEFAAIPVDSRSASNRSSAIDPYADPGLTVKRRSSLSSYDKSQFSVPLQPLVKIHIGQQNGGQGIQAW